MEEENRKARKVARREYNENVRELASFVRKRDKRVSFYQVGVGHRQSFGFCPYHCVLLCMRYLPLLSAQHHIADSQSSECIRSTAGCRMLHGVARLQMSNFIALNI